MERQIPSDIEVEGVVLGALLVEKEAFAKVESLITADSFYDLNNRKIYDAINKLYNEQQPIDVITVKNELDKGGACPDGGWAFKVISLANTVSSSAHIVKHASYLSDLKARRDVISIATKMLNQGYDKSVDIAETIEQGESFIQQINSTNVVTDYKHIKDILPDVYDEITASASNTDGMSGIPSGFHDLDKKTSGWQNTDLIIVAGRPAMGKTAFTLSMARNIAQQSNVAVGVFSLEMGEVQLVKRLLSTESSVDSNKIRSGQMHSEEWTLLDKGIQSLYNTPIYLDDKAELSITEFKAKARKMVRDHGVKVIMIDYLQLMTANMRSREQEVGYISRSLKAIAKELKIPIIALSQLNREAETRDGLEGKRPQLSDLRESGSIEQDADIVCFLYRPEYYKLLQDDMGKSTKGMVEIIIAKHRNGETGTVKLRFRGEYTRFENIDNYSDSLQQINGDNMPF